MEQFSRDELQNLNRLLLGIHATTGLLDMCDTVLREMPNVIPHDKSFFSYARSSDSAQDSAFRSLTMTPAELELYRRMAAQDYTSWYTSQEEISVYRDSDIVSDEVLRRSRIFTEWAEPMGMRYICGNVIRSGERRFACFTLLRRGDHGDYSDREMLLFSVITDHIQQWYQQHSAMAFLKADASEPEFLSLLTNREQELARLVRSGLTLREISDQLSVSYDTTRRHIANIYSKLGIHSRAQLTSLFR